MIRLILAYLWRLLFPVADWCQRHTMMTIQAVGFGFILLALWAPNRKKSK